MKPAGKINIGILSTWMLAGLGVCLLAGCASSAAQDRKVYDRYAELVAARNRTQQSPASTSVAPAPAVRPAAGSTDLADRRPRKAEPVAKPASPAAVAAPDLSAKPAPVPAPPVQVIEPKPVEKIEPAPAGAPAPVDQPAPVPVVAPVLVPVVQEAAPTSAPAATPVPALPAAVPEAAPVPPVPAPFAPVVPEPVLAPVALPAPTSAPAATSVPAPVENPGPASSSSPDGAYVLKVGDGIQVFLRGIPTPDVIEDQIDEDGTISVPFINEVHAAGITASDLERTIRKTYLDRDIYRNITVNVVVPSRFYFIQGEIRAPGRFQIMSATRVSQAIAGSGGYTEYASGQVLVKRGGKIIKTIRDSRRLERTPEDDILLEPDDIIEVKRSLW